MNGNWNVSNFSCDEGQLIEISRRVAGLPRFGMRDEWSGHLVTSLSIRRHNAVVVSSYGNLDPHMSRKMLRKRFCERGVRYEVLSAEMLLRSTIHRKRFHKEGFWLLYDIGSVENVKWKSQSGNILIAERDAKDISSFRLELRSKAESRSFFQVILRSVLG